MSDAAVAEDVVSAYKNNNTICIVDDGFRAPAQELNKETSKVFFTHDIEELIDKKWDDEAVKILCSNLLRSGWEVQAFSHPNFYENKLENDVYISDILVFDWEYSTGETGQVDILKRILSEHPVFVYIFSGADKEDEIEKVIKEYLANFKDRVAYLSKNGDLGYEETAKSFSDKLTQMKENNFSFSFGSAIRNVVSNGIENILVKFVDMDLNKVLDLLSHEQSDEELNLDIKKIISSKVSEYIRTSTGIKDALCKEGVKSDVVEEMLGLIEGKIKNSIISAKLLLPKVSTSPTAAVLDINTIRQLWSFRLYHKPLDTDKVVRTGDIIKKDGSEDFSKLYIVITDNCSLSRFGGKTGGILNTIELNKVSEYTNHIKIGGLSSLTNIKGLDGTDGKPLLLPYLPVDEGKMEDYLLFMQNHFPISCEVKDRKSPLIYENIGYSRICSISSPFLHPLIGTIITNLFGWGCPDYPSEVQKDIVGRCKPKADIVSGVQSDNSPKAVVVKTDTKAEENK